MIKLKDITSDTYTNASGYSFYLMLLPFFEKNESCHISFEEVGAFSSSFLNSSFGQLIEDFGLDKFKTIIKVSKISAINADMLKRYISSFSNVA